MTARGSSDGAAGEPARQNPVPHIPVLLAEVLACLRLKSGGLYCDGTFGAGGYTRAILAADPTIRVLALDRDPDAIFGGYALVQSSAGRLTLSEANFGTLDSEAETLGLAPLDGVVLDIGVSSMQLDQAERGFSFRHDGPLDMRMAQTGISAADLINEADETHLADIFYHYGEERRSRQVAKAVVAARAISRIETTAQLANIVAKIIYAKPGQMHPATRVFQALRIAVNDELGELVSALQAAERVLKPGGVLAVVTFHSLEDRIVKQFFAARSGRAGGSRFQPEAPREVARFDLSGKWPVIAGDAEIAGNPRARSAKLRAGIRTEAPALGVVDGLAALARLPEVKGGKR